MRLSELSGRILGELSSILQQVDENDAEKLVEGILSSGQIFITGMGRSGLIARSFAMRLMQMGLPVYLVGDTTTPAIAHGDLLIAISGSGETSITYYMASTAKRLGADVFLLTAQAESSIGDVSDLVLVLPNAPQPALPLMSAFEDAAYIFLDAVVILIMEKTGVTFEEAPERDSEKRHELTPGEDGPHDHRAH